MSELKKTQRLTLQPMGPAEILMELIDKAIKDLELIRREVYSSVPMRKFPVTKNEVIDPRTGQPFVYKSQMKSKPKRSKTGKTT